MAIKLLRLKKDFQKLLYKSNSFKRTTKVLIYTFSFAFVLLFMSIKRFPANATTRLPSVHSDITDTVGSESSLYSSKTMQQRQIRVDLNLDPIFESEGKILPQTEANLNDIARPRQGPEFVISPNRPESFRSASKADVSASPTESENPRAIDSTSLSGAPVFVDKRKTPMLPENIAQEYGAGASRLVQHQLNVANAALAKGKPAKGLSHPLSFRQSTSNQNASLTESSNPPDPNQNSMSRLGDDSSETASIYNPSDWWNCSPCCSRRKKTPSREIALQTEERLNQSNFSNVLEQASREDDQRNQTLSAREFARQQLLTSQGLSIASNLSLNEVESFSNANVGEISQDSLTTQDLALSSASALPSSSQKPRDVRVYAQDPTIYTQALCEELLVTYPDFGNLKPITDCLVKRYETEERLKEMISKDLTELYFSQDDRKLINGIAPKKYPATHFLATLFKGENVERGIK